MDFSVCFSILKPTPSFPVARKHIKTRNKYKVTANQSLLSLVSNCHYGADTRVLGYRVGWMDVACLLHQWGSYRVIFTCMPARLAQTAISNVDVLLGLLISGEIGK